jgi:hypothetical protein
MAKIAELLNEMNGRLKVIEADQKMTLVQTTKTNGRVDVLENQLFGRDENNPGVIQQVHGLIRWRSSARGAWAALVIVCSIAATIGGIVIGILAVMPH